MVVQAKFFSFIFVVAVVLCAYTNTADAVLVQFSMTGTVTTATAGNDYGLTTTNPNNIITASGTFDSSSIGNDLLTGSGNIDFTGINQSLTIQVGSITFTESLANNINNTELQIVNGSLAHLNYAGTNNSDTFDSLPSNSFLGNDNNLGYILGDWDINLNLTAVPVPAAVWLFGTGLIGLIGIARRKAV